MDNRLIYWMLARFPRPLVVFLVGIAKPLYWIFGVALPLYIAGFAISLDFYANVGRLDIYAVIFCAVILAPGVAIIIVASGLIFLVFLLEAAHNLRRWTVEHFDNIDRQLPSREK